MPLTGLLNQNFSQTLSEACIRPHPRLTGHVGSPLSSFFSTALVTSVAQGASCPLKARRRVSSAARPAARYDRQVSYCLHIVRVGIFVIVIGPHDDDRVYPENVARVMVSSQRSNTLTKVKKTLSGLEISFKFRADV